VEEILSPRHHEAIDRVRVIYHPRKCVISDLFVITESSQFLSLATNIAVNARKPALLQLFSRTIRGLMPQGRWKCYSFLVNGQGLESIVENLRSYQFWPSI
jgi:hypothetical protein